MRCNCHSSTCSHHPRKSAVLSNIDCKTNDVHNSVLITSLFVYIDTLKHSFAAIFSESSD